MLKQLILLLFFTLLLKANFWMDIDNQKIITSTTIVESNSSVTEVNATVLRQRVLFFNDLINIIKTKPYSLKDGTHSFYDEQKFAFQKQILTSKIELNSKKNYNNSVLRDKLKLDELNLKNSMYDSLLGLSSVIQDNDIVKIKETISSHLLFLQKINMQNYQFQILSYEIKSSSLRELIKTNFESLSKLHNFSTEFFTYLLNNQSLLKNSSFLNLGSMIEYLNNKSYFSKINFYLNKVNSDIGRILIFLLVVIVFIIFKNLLFKLIFPFVRKILDDDKENFNDVLFDNFERIKKPLSYIVMIFGLDLALETLVYPKPMSDWWVNTSYLIYLIIYSKIIIVVIDLFLEIYLHKKEKSKKSLRKELVNLFVIILKSIIYVIVFLLFIRQLGIDITGFIASLGIGGLAFAFAAKDTIANFFGSIKIIFDNAFSQGDWIKTDDAEGTVIEIGLISTTVRTFDNALVTVPNANIANSAIKNWNRRELGRRIKMYVGVTYDAKKEDLQKAVIEIREMLTNHPDIATQQKSNLSKQKRKLLSYEDSKGVKKTLLVYVDEFAESSINIMIYSFTNSTNWKSWLEIKEDVLYKIWDILEANNLQLAFPSQTVYLKKENNDKEK